jgi:hypothetical protein
MGESLQARQQRELRREAAVERFRAVNMEMTQLSLDGEDTSEARRQFLDEQYQAAIAEIHRNDAPRVALIRRMARFVGIAYQAEPKISDKPSDTAR